jgi:hypothetical protein
VAASFRAISLLAAGLALLLGVAPVADAQEDGPRPDPEVPEASPGQEPGVRTTRRKRLARMDEEELRQAGFEWEAQNARSGSVIAGLVATGPGFFFHGLGHLYAGDRETGWSLMGSEGIGAGLLLSGTLLYLGTKRDSFASKSGMGLAQLGGATFSVGYLSDVIGSFKGSQSELLPLSTPAEGLGAHGRYTLLLADGLNFHNLLRVRAHMDFGRVYIHPEAELDVLLDYQRYGAVAGLRVVRGEPRNHLALQLRVERASFTQASGGRSVSADGSSNDAVLRAQVETELSLNMGQLIDHLRNIVQVLRVGVGFADGAGARAAIPGNQTRAYFVMEPALLINLTPSLLLRPYYIYSEAELLRPLDAGLGLFGGEVRLQTQEDLEIHIDLRVGQGVGLMFGTTWWL